MCGFSHVSADFVFLSRELGMAQSDLRRVKRVAGKLEKVRAELRDAILAASRAGESVRDIAPWAGMSPSRVHELLQEARNLEHDRQQDSDGGVR